MLGMTKLDQTTERVLREAEAAASEGRDSAALLVHQHEVGASHFLPDVCVELAAKLEGNGHQVLESTAVSGRTHT